MSSVHPPSFAWHGNNPEILKPSVEEQTQIKISGMQNFIPEEGWETQTSYSVSCHCVLKALWVCIHKGGRSGYFPIQDTTDNWWMFLWKKAMGSLKVVHLTSYRNNP